MASCRSDPTQTGNTSRREAARGGSRFGKAENNRMKRTPRNLALLLLAAMSLGGCAGRYHGAPDAVSKIGLLEQVEMQQLRIETLEWEVAELWKQCEIERIDVLERRVAELWERSQQERIETLEWQVADLQER